MTNDVITKENLTKDLLFQLFDAAFMTPTIDHDGDLSVEDVNRCWVMVDEEHGRIQLYSQWRFKPETKSNDRLACVNKINADFVLPRAYVRNDALCLDYVMPVDGGLTPRHVVLATKAFLRQELAAVMEAQDLIQ